MEEAKCLYRGFPISRSEAMAIFMKTSFYNPEKEYIVQCVSSDLCYTIIPRSIEPFFIIREQKQQHQQQQYMNEGGIPISLRMNGMDDLSIGEDGTLQSGYEEDENESDVFYYGVSGNVVKSSNSYDLSVLRLTECASFLNKFFSSESMASMGFYDIKDDIDDVFDDDDEVNDGSNNEVNGNFQQ